MEINQTDYESIENMIQRLSNNRSYELEIRMNDMKKRLGNQENNNKNKNSNNDASKVDYTSYIHLLKHLIFSKENGGLGYTFEQETILDIRLENYRVSLKGVDNVKKYWIKNQISDDIDLQYETKEIEQTIYLNEYHVKIILSRENTNLSNDVKQTIKEHINDPNITKVYRLKNRYIIKTEDGIYEFHLTTLKQTRNTSFQKSNIFTEIPQYEIEIEYCGDVGVEPERIMEKMFENLELLLIYTQNTNRILTDDFYKYVIRQYSRLIDYSGNILTADNPNRAFIAANPITLHLENIKQRADGEGQVNTILKNYAVTPKADGQRNFLYILDTSNNSSTQYDSENGSLLFINNNFHVFNTGIKMPEWAGTLIEGEFIMNENLYLAYDILFERRNDVRRRPLATIGLKKDVNLQRMPRYKLLEIFFRDYQELKKREDVDQLMKIRLKEFRFATGTDIFDKSREILQMQKNLPYHSDGLIFVPIQENYPEQGGTWNEIFKWKPSILNSIDFLIQVEKDEYGNEKKYPYFDGKIMRQYKVVHLYVTGLENIYDETQMRMIKRAYPKLFNPENVSDDEIDQYCKANIFMNSDDRLMAVDPLDGLQEEIFGNTIVEFIYDPEQPEGFHWKPIRNRYDKTEKYRNGDNVFGNFERVAIDNWESIQNPITEEIITTGIIPENIAVGQPGAEGEIIQCKLTDDDYISHIGMDRFENVYIRQKYIQHCVNLLRNSGILDTSRPLVGKLFDISHGKKDDLAVWKETRLDHIVSINTIKECVDYGMQNYKTYPRPKPRVNYLWADASRLIFPDALAALNDITKQKMQEYIPTKYMFDVVSMPSGLAEYFEDEIKLRTLIQNVNDQLKVGGYFWGVGLDGEKVYQALKTKKLLEENINERSGKWKIEKKYTLTKWDNRKIAYGKKIGVMIKVEENGEEVDLEENLINFDGFDALMNEYGFERQEYSDFGSIYEQMLESERERFELTNEEKIFSFMNMVFVYRKTQNSRDALYTGLIDKMTKKEKKNAKNLVKSENNVE